MADIISGKSRFNGNKNAPVRRIISINNETAAASELPDEDVLEEEEVRVERIVELLEEYGSESMKKVVTKALKDNLIPLEKSVI